MKKLIALCVSAILTFGLLSSCGQTAGSGHSLPTLDPTNPISLEIWHYYNGPQLTAFDLMVTEFNETVGMERGIIVESFNQGSVGELIAKVIDATNQKVGAMEVPDVFAAYADTAYDVDKLGLLASLDPYLTPEELAEYRPEFIEEGRFSADDTLKIFPIAKSVELLMLNRTDWDKFATATGSDPSALSTFEGVTRTAQAYYSWTDGLTPTPDDGKAFFGRDAMANYFIIGCRQMGVELFQGSGNDVTIHADKAAIRRLWDNYYVPFISGWFSANGRFRSDGAHMGDLIALVGSSSGAAYFPTEVSVSDFEYYPIESIMLPAPIFQGGASYAVQQGAGMCVTKSDAATEYAATVFLRWFTEEDRNMAFSASSGYLPVKHSALNPALLSTVLARQDKGVSPNIRLALEAALEVASGSTLYTTQAFEGGNTARNVLEHTMSDQADADRQAILALAQQGTPMAQAIARYNTDGNFDTWYDKLISDLNDAHHSSVPKSRISRR